MGKRLLDIIAASIGLLLLAPLLLLAMLAIWLQDYHSPFYIAPRIGRGGKPFSMVKLRSMVIKADCSGVDSTSANDARITTVGKLIRRFKLDEIPQLLNVVKGEMSLVGPRPNVARDVALYTKVEAGLLSVRPGITDFSSIVFADEGDILKDSRDPDLDYNQRIRPWKSRLGLFYVEHASLTLDFTLLWLTVLTIIARPKALAMVHAILRSLDAPQSLCMVALRLSPLAPYPPPGAEQVVQSRAVA